MENLLNEFLSSDIVQKSIIISVAIMSFRFAVNCVFGSLGCGYCDFPELSDIVDFFNGIFSKFKKKPEHSVYYNEHYNGFFEDDYNEKILWG